MDDELGSESRPSPDWAELTHECLTNILSRLILSDRWTGPMLVCSSWLRACKDSSLHSALDLENQFESVTESSLWWTPAFERKIDAMLRSVVDWSDGSLTEIRIRHCSDRSLAFVAERCPSLEVLSIKSCPNVTDASMAKIAFRCPQIRELDVSYCYEISHESLVSMGRNCPNLKILKRSFMNWLDPSQHIGVVPNEYLNACPQDGDSEAAAIGNSMPHLEHLELKFSKLSAKGLALISEGCLNLEYLDLSGCANLTGRDIANASSNLKNLKNFVKPELYIPSCLSMEISNERNVDNCEDIPKLGMKFDSEEAAFNFYNYYGRRVGFSIRRGSVGRTKKTKELTSRIFLCCKEGVRDSKRRDQLPNYPRAETRCGCNAHMGIKINREKCKFEIYTLTVEHNHELVPARCSYMMGLQRRISDLHATQIELAEQSGIPLRSAYELLGREAGGRESLGFTKQDQKNYLRGRRQKNLAFGEAGSIYEYFKKQSFENDSFYSAVQFDSEELITNIFWADARMIMDYGIFGDVVSFDTTYKINKEHRPFAVFVGFNHHRETVVFGAALMYDETVESYKWLFRTFLEAMCNKSPKTILMDQDAAMAIAIKEEFPSTFHRLCKWHIMQNALKHTNNIGKRDPDACTIKNKIAYLMDNLIQRLNFYKSGIVCLTSTMFGRIGG